MVKKGISILLLMIYLMVNFMPYIPYIYTATETAKSATHTSQDIVSSASVSTGDMCYLKAITKRSSEKKETKTPQIIIVNNLEFTPLCANFDIRSYLVKDVEFEEIRVILVNHIKRPDSPPPKSAA